MVIPMRHCVALLGVLAGPMASGQAQAPTLEQLAISARPEPIANTPASPARISVTQWSESPSRSLFHAADADLDDRLDVFEFSAALEGIPAPRDVARFRRLDIDRDGFLGWSEFDRHMQDVVSGGGVFRLTPVRPLPEPAPAASGDARPAQVATPAERAMRLWDADRDGALSRTELEAMIAGTSLPPTLLAHVGAFDRDGSGTVSAEELQPMLALMPGLFQVAGATAAASTLPAPWRELDLDGDGAVGDAELAAGLRRSDPLLSGWAAVLLRAADQNSDRRLDAGELTRPAAAPGQVQAQPTGSVAPATRPGGPGR